MTKFVAANPVPLFDRIAGAADLSFDGRLMDSGGLMSSLQRDLGRLFNVRNGMTVADFLSYPDTDADFPVRYWGMPCLLTLSAQSAEDLAKLEAVVARAIARFEPRLQHVQVKAARDPKRNSSARVAIAAAVSTGNQLCRVDFDVTMDSQTVQFEGGA
ncbi:type VI secretion system baseplate subunit TssE [Ramlibacter sp.]|uniref:type VI secretion system baseplate subunit TssE n=1 Tax=Ramlibacter sp. TaxID=1917967 RepID=UPI003D1451A6